MPDTPATTTTAMAMQVRMRAGWRRGRLSATDDEDGCVDGLCAVTGSNREWLKGWRREEV